MAAEGATSCGDRRPRSLSSSDDRAIELKAALDSHDSLPPGEMRSAKVTSFLRFLMTIRFQKSWRNVAPLCRWIRFSPRVLDRQPVETANLGIKEFTDVVVTGRRRIVLPTASVLDALRQSAVVPLDRKSSLLCLSRGGLTSEKGVGPDPVSVATTSRLAGVSSGCSTTATVRRRSGWGNRHDSSVSGPGRRLPRRRSRESGSQREMPPGTSKDVNEILQYIVGMTDDFCHQHLNEEYATLCRKLAASCRNVRYAPRELQEIAFEKGLVQPVHGTGFGKRR